MRENIPYLADEKRQELKELSKEFGSSFNITKVNGNRVDVSEFDTVTNNCSRVHLRVDLAQMKTLCYVIGIEYHNKKDDAVIYCVKCGDSAFHIRTIMLSDVAMQTTMYRILKMLIVRGLKNTGVPEQLRENRRNLQKMRDQQNRKKAADKKNLDIFQKIFIEGYNSGNIKIDYKKSTLAKDNKIAFSISGVSSSADGMVYVSDMPYWKYQELCELAKSFKDKTK